MSYRNKNGWREWFVNFFFFSVFAGIVCMVGGGVYIAYCAVREAEIEAEIEVNCAEFKPTGNMICEGTEYRKICKPQQVCIRSKGEKHE